MPLGIPYISQLTYPHSKYSSANTFRIQLLKSPKMNFCLLFWVILNILLVSMATTPCRTTEDLNGPKTWDELQEAIDKATYGSIIELLPIEYKGDFVLKTKNPDTNVTLKGCEGFDKRSKIVGFGAALTVKKGIWTISGLDIESAAVGVVLKGPNNLLEFIYVKNVENGFTINGDGNTVRNCTVAASYDGIIVKASDSVIHDVTLKGSGIQIKSGSNNTLTTTSITGIPQDSTAVTISGESNSNLLESISIENGIVKIKGNFNTIHDLNGTVSIIVDGDVNTLYDLNVEQSVTVKGEYNTLHDLSVKDSISVKGLNNTLYDLSIQGSLFLVCGNNIGSYNASQSTVPFCD